MNASSPRTSTAPAVDDPVLEVRNASVSFDMERGESKVLNDVSLDIQRNEILGIVGESGSGKSMFADSLLNAVVDPGVTTGEIRYHPEDGESVDILQLSDEELAKYRWETISMVFQGAMSSFNPTQTIRSHFRETIQAHGYPMDESMDHARNLLTDLYLEPERVLDSYPHELSGGMQQRALIALSLVLDPDVLVMDEPTAALDLLMQRSILGLIEDLQDSYDLTVVFITHDLPLVAGLADRLAVLYAFEFAEIGPTEELIQNAAHPYTRALLNAVPNLEAPLNEMTPIDGSSPDPVDVSTGCNYAPRCPLAEDQCLDSTPEFQSVSSDHSSACYNWADAESEIPISLDEEITSEWSNVEGIQSAEPVVSLDDVEVHFELSGGLLDMFEDNSYVQAVDGVDLDVYENDVIALVGESGCGKTTLGKTAIGVQRPTDGSVTYRGQDIWDAKDGAGEIPYDEIRQSLQIIHQDPGSSLNPNRTIQKTLEVPLEQSQPELTFKDRRERILGMLEYVGMTPPEDYAGRYPHQLSGGEKQRVALVRALFMNPDVILADEAVSALDVSLRVEMMDLMLDLQDRFNTSFIFVSHNLSNARYLAGKVGGRIGVMYLGNLVEIGPAEEVINNPSHPYTKVLKWSTTDLGEDDSADEPPVRGIDIPDPVDPPSGCPFHTRCPEAREVCKREEPGIDATGSPHQAACFREDSTHEYWKSDPLDNTSS